MRKWDLCECPPLRRIDAANVITAMYSAWRVVTPYRRSPGIDDRRRHQNRKHDAAKMIFGAVA